jgi:hypothetical protein
VPASALGGAVFVSLGVSLALCVLLLLGAYATLRKAEL